VNANFLSDGATMHVRVRQATLHFTDKWAHGVGRHLGVNLTSSRVSRLFERATVPWWPLQHAHGCCGGWPGETGTVGTDVVGPVPGT
jgi:hypothetical protein